MHQAAPLPSQGLEAAMLLLRPKEDYEQATGALRSLIEGNRRFCQTVQEGCINSKERRLELRESQAPIAVVVCCSDSRCPPELIFDQGYGYLFVVRVAGNVVDQHALGSISYALQHLRARLIIVMGHMNCGAIKASVADFVDSTTKRLAEREEELAEAEAEAAEAAEAADLPRKRKESRSLFSRIFALLGGKEEVAQLVRTASFRDAEHAAHPINSIVLSIAPAVKDVVWALLQAPAEAMTQYAPTSPRAEDANAGGVPPEGSAVAGGSASAGLNRVSASSSSSSSSESSDNRSSSEEEDGSPVKAILGDLKRNSSAWALRELTGYSEEDEEEGQGEGSMGSGKGGSSGGEGDSATEWEAACGSEASTAAAAAALGTSLGRSHSGRLLCRTPSQQYQQYLGRTSQYLGRTSAYLHRTSAAQSDPDHHHLAPMRWDCDDWGGATHTAPEIPEHELHRELAESSSTICLHTAMRCSKVVNTCIYQNVRRQGGEIWETMTNWVPPEHMRHVVMAAAVYDLNTGRVDIFGLQTT